MSDDCTLLDVGSGDGLIAFGALAQNPSCRVIFSDISQDLLDHAELLAADMRVTDRCQFLRASATDLSPLQDASVEAVTLRSVLIYVANKEQAMSEFYRVLKPGGRLSLFEPINRFGEPQPDHMFWGFDVTPIVDAARKVKQVYQALQPLDADPMMNFDQRDLLSAAEQAGFREIRLALEVEIKPISDVQETNVTWESFLRTAGNPKIPTIGEAIAQVLTPDEAAAFAAHMRPRVETGTGTFQSAVAYLTATK